MSLRKLLAIGKRFGCEQEIREWMAGSIVSMGCSRIVDITAPYYDETLKARHIEYVKNDLALELGKAIMESPATTKEVFDVRTEYYPRKYSDMLTYRVLVVKADPKTSEHTQPENVTSEHTQPENVAESNLV